MYMHMSMPHTHIYYYINNKPWVPVDFPSNRSLTDPLIPDLTFFPPQDRFLQNLVRLCVNTSCTALLRRQRLLEKLDAGHGKLQAAWLSPLLDVLAIASCRNQKILLGDT